jgi:hypothetical protein
VAGQSDRHQEINRQRVGYHGAYALGVFLPFRHFSLKFGDPTLRKKREDPGFLLPRSEHDHVFGFLYGKSHDFLRIPPRPPGDLKSGAPLLFVAVCLTGRGNTGGSSYSASSIERHFLPQ